MAIHGTKIMWRTLRNEKNRLQRKKHQLQIKERRLQIKEGLLQAVGTTGQTAITAANVARQTSAFLQEAAHMEGGAEVAEVLLSFAQALTEDTSPKAAASVLEEIGKVAEKMDKKLKAFQAVQQVEIMIRDIVVLRCLACIDPMNREAFIEALKDAFDKKELERDLRALLLLAHQKACNLHGINHTFKSASEKKKTTRPPRKRKGNANANPAAEDHGIFHLACGHCTNDLREDCAQCKQHYEKMESGHGDATEPAASSTKSLSLSEFPLPAYVPLPKLPSTNYRLLSCIDPIGDWNPKLLVNLGGTDRYIL